MNKLTIRLICLVTLFILCFQSCMHPTEPSENRVSNVSTIVVSVGNQLCSINSDGSNLQIIAKGRPTSQPFWSAHISPDGSKIVYQAATTTYQQIFLFDRFTHVTKNITADSAYHETPVFSPNGKLVLYVTSKNWIQNMCTYEISTGHVTQLTQGLNCLDPSYSLDGSKIVFYLSNGGDSNGVSIIDPDGTNFRLLGSGSNPSFFPNGKKILFQNMISANDNGLFMMNSDGSGRTFWLKVDWGTVTSISPDGSLVATEYFSGNRDIATIKSDGSGFVNITHDTAAEYCPLFLHDDATIAYTVDDTSKVWYLDLMNFDGGNRRHILQSNDPIYFPSY